MSALGTDNLMMDLVWNTTGTLREEVVACISLLCYTKIQEAQQDTMNSWLDEGNLFFPMEKS